MLIQVAEWYTRAERNLGACKILLHENDSLLSVAAMQLQESVENYLKGYLISKSWALDRIRNLDRSLTDLATIEPDFAKFIPACAKINAYAGYRYSLRLPSPLSRAEVEESLTQAEALIARIRSRTP